MGEVEVKKTICMWCHGNCEVNVHVKDGQLVKVVADEKYPGNKELHAQTVRSCPRAVKAADWFHHPDRLDYPLKRSGERGEGKWGQISWEQAMDEIADKLDEIRNKYGAEAIATSSGTARTHDEYRGRFFNLLGSPNNAGQGTICWGPANVVSAIVCGGSVVTASRPPTKCTIMWGTNPQQSMWRLWLNTVRRQDVGEKLIVIDPRRTRTAERADLWLPIRPGTDCALAMAMINVIIEEELYDKEFVNKWCYGFDQLSERAKEYPPDKVAEISWIPADKIREVARTYATNKPSIIVNHMGIEQLPNGIEALHARYILTAITGNLDIRGGELIRRRHPSIVSNFEIELNNLMPAEQKAKQIGSDRFRLMSFPGYELTIESAQRTGSEFCRTHNCLAHAPSVYEAMITGKPYPIRAMITMSSNPLVTQANTKHVYKALKSLDLYVVMDYWLTPSAEIADYVPPAASWLERPAFWTRDDTHPIIEVGEAALPHQVPGQYDRRRDYDLWRGLGIRLGQGEYWPWETLEDAFNSRLAPLGYNSIEEFIAKKNGSDRARFEDKTYEKVGFATPTTKVELYSTILEKLGYDPLPKYIEPVESPNNIELTKEFPLILITGARHQPFYHSEHRQVDSLRKMHPQPLVQINPKTASELGISDGDWVWIETPRGRVRQKCQYFDGIDPRVVSAQHGWWFPEMPGEEPWLRGVWQSNIDVVTNDDPEHCNQINGGWPLRTLMCKIYKVKSY